MICLQIINLLSEYKSPHIFAEEFDHIKRVREAWPVSREPANDFSLYRKGYSSHNYARGLGSQNPYAYLF